MCFQGAQKEGVCDDADAKRLWDKTYEKANERVRAAMRGLIESSRTYGIRFGKTSRTPILGQPGRYIQREFGEAGPPTKRYDGGTITIDTDGINRNLHINDARLVLGHEVGHFYLPGEHEAAEAQIIADFENPLREALGFPRRGRYADPYPRLPPPGGVRFP